ncbi:MAG: hypothetical protein RIM84_06490 [Alphaproteobacteria bacterium]
MSILLGLMLLALPAAAKDIGIAAFFGVWEGNAVSESEISLYFRLTSRDIGVEVRPAGEGFSITWKTVQRQKGDPNKPVEELKSATTTYQPVRAGVWAAEANRDPLSAPGAVYSWAHVRDNTLVIKSLAIDADGGHEMQIYERTLSGTGMSLSFSRLQDGQEVRTATGRLIKVAK